MIKIEFKEVQFAVIDSTPCDFKFITGLKLYLNRFYVMNGIGCSAIEIERNYNKVVGFRTDNIFTVAKYSILKDPYLDRSFILQQLGITPEQDELNQNDWEKV